MPSTDPMPGRAREVDTVLAGRLIERTLYIDAAHADGCAERWATGRYTQLGIAEKENPGLSDLSCLEVFTAVSSVHLMLDRAVDVSPLEAHARSLQRFFCNDDLNGLRNCEPFTALQHLGQRWRADLRFAATHPVLQRLSLTHFSPQSADLGSLPDAPNLQGLNLFKPGIKSLSGVARFTHLRGLSVGRAMQLVDVTELANLHELEDVSFDGCRKVQDFAQSVRGLGNLSKVVYSSCSALTDLAFVSDLPRLRWLNILGTDVLSSDRSPIASHPTLDQIMCTSTPGASHTEAQLRQALRLREEERGL
nr:leucine-rich repeat domain-containing protein [uncultured Aquabacterium sp.]